MGGEGWQNKDGSAAMNALREYTFSLVASEIDRKEKANIRPLLARLDDMQRILVEDFRKVLREFTKDGTLTYHSDINGRVMFEFKKPE